MKHAASIDARNAFARLFARPSRARTCRFRREMPRKPSRSARPVPAIACIALFAVLAGVLASCRGGRECAPAKETTPVGNAVLDVAVIGIYNAMTTEQRRQSDIPDAPASLLDASGYLRYPADDARYIEYRDWLYHHSSGNATKFLARDAQIGAGQDEAFDLIGDKLKEGRYLGNDKERPEVVRVVEEVTTAAASIGIYNALGEDRRRELGVPEVPAHLRSDRFGVKLTDQTERGEFLTWLYHPDRLPGASPGAANPIGPMADEALRDSGFDRVLRSSGLRCS